jgi:hypothetical protein
LSAGQQNSQRDAVFVPPLRQLYRSFSRGGAGASVGKSLSRGRASKPAEEVARSVADDAVRCPGPLYRDHGAFAGRVYILEPLGDADVALRIIVRHADADLVGKGFRLRPAQLALLRSFERRDDVESFAPGRLAKADETERVQPPETGAGKAGGLALLSQNAAGDRS